MHCLFENTVFLAHIGRSGLQKGPGKQGEGPKKHHDKEAALKETLRDAPCHWQTGQGSKKHARNACQGVVNNTFGHKACQHIKPCGKAHAENKEGAKDPPGHVLVPAVQVDADSQGNAAKAHHTGKKARDAAPAKKHRRFALRPAPTVRCLLLRRSRCGV